MKPISMWKMAKERAVKEGRPLPNAVSPAPTGYYPCMKNGSMTVHGWLGVTSPWYPREIKYESTPEDTWCIWREPVARFQSAVNHMRETRPLEEVFERIPTTYDYHYDDDWVQRHFLPQETFMGPPEDHANIFLIDQMGLVQEFLEDKLGKKLEYRHVNTAEERKFRRNSKTENPTFQREFSPDEIKLIEDYYARDIEIYWRINGNS